LKTYGGKVPDMVEVEALPIIKHVFGFHQAVIVLYFIILLTEYEMVLKVQILILHIAVVHIVRYGQSVPYTEL
jgi:hypothetical protein